jgi:ATP-binding cassette subfamily F protein 3
MLQVNNLSKGYGERVLLDSVSFVVNSGEKVGLIGRNGHGKTTIFRVLTGEENADDGGFSVPSNYSIGVLKQYFDFTEPTVLQEACLALPEQEGGWKEEYKAEAILSGLGFSDTDMHRHPSEFSGGFQMRINLTTVLLSEPNLLLLDEPTNYLDIVSIRWLERFLIQWPNEFILITHDRKFMDTVCGHTMGINRKSIKKIQGDTHKWHEQVAEEEEIYEKTRVNEDAKRAEVEKFIERFRAKASKAQAVQSKVKLLEKQGKREKLETEKNLAFAFKKFPFSGKRFQTIEDLKFGYEEDRILIHDITLNIHPGDRIAVIGPNGTGKSTLLSLLAGELEPLDGSIKNHDALKIGYFGQTNVNRLNFENSVYDEIGFANPELSISEARGISGLMMFEGDAALKKIGVLSGGEKSRVLLGKILACPVGMLLLDEPTHHLDMQSVGSLKTAIKEFDGAVVLVSHDELLVGDIATKLIVYDDDTIFMFEGTYAEFLERVGWSFERKEGTSKVKQKKPAMNKKEQRKQRAERNKDKSSNIGPLKKQVEALEREITNLEGALERQHQLLEEASDNNDNEALVDVTQKIGELQKKIDTTFEEFEKASLELEEKEKEFSGN